MLPFIVAALLVILSCLLAWAAGLLAALSGTLLLVVRIVIVLVGIAAAAVAAWWLRRRASASTAPENAALTQLIAAAEAKLAASQHAGKGGLRSFPLVYVLGESSSAKTTVVLKSGLDPELLGGEVYRDRDIIPTQLSNVWFTQGAVLVEAGARILGDASLWRQLVHSTRPSTYRGAFGFGHPPFRAAVVCVPCEHLLAAGGTEAVKANAATMGERLRELARELGSQTPTYVLFTKLDRVPGFNEFVRNLSAEEAASLLGSGISAPASGANYIEAAHTGIGASFDRLLFSLAGARVDLLQREGDAARLAGVYEFPRELRKLRDHLSTFLAELGRPSHLNTNPQLRGFYFTGVRAFLREQAGFEPVASQPVSAGLADATSIFSSRPAPQPVAPAPVSRTAEKIAQWTFLPRFFPGAVLGDVAAIPGGRSSHAIAVRRWLCGGAAALLLLYLLLLTISWANNAALERGIAEESTALAAEPPQAGQVANTAQLTHLDHLRVSLQQLEAFRTAGPPLMYRWGLYRGDDLIAPTCQLYFRNFEALLLGRSESNLLTAMNALPATAGPAPAPGTDYNSMYAALRAYLITTIHPEKSTTDFLPPVLESFWESASGSSNPSVGADERQLARIQMGFYAATLPKTNPFNLAPAASTVNRTRTYLASFGGFERIYSSMLTAADKAGSAVDFNSQHPGSAATVLDPRIVPAAFTKAGFAFMGDALAHPEHYFQGEAWVLGEQAPPSIDQANLRQKLQARYTDDFIAQWRAFLKEASVVRYRDLKDAGGKLTALSGNGSPLLALFATVSANTNVPDPAISAAFQPTGVLVPGTAKDAYIGPGNKSYMDALLALNGAIQGVASAPGGSTDPASAAPVATAASAAHIAAQQTAQTFHIDPAGHTDSLTLALLEAPITSADALARGMGPAAANAGGKGFCAAFTAVFTKQPFAPASTAQATPAEVTALLQPGTGALAQFYNANLKTLLLQQGSTYVPAPNAPAQVTPAFLRFFNRVTALSQTLFPTGATAPTLTFTIKPLPGGGIQGSQLKIDNQALTNTEGAKQFTWSAATAQSASLTANSLPVGFDGPWAIFLLFEKAHIQRTGAAYEVSFPLQVANTPVKAPDGTPVVARYELSGPGADVLVPGSWSGNRCVSEVAR